MYGFVVLSVGKSGAIALAPQLGNPGRGIHQVHEQWGSRDASFRAPLGASLPFSCRPRNRVGLDGLARPHARRQFEWHVHRIRRPALGWRWIFRTIDARPPCAHQLLREARRTRTRHGRFHFHCRRSEQRTVPGADQRSLRESALTKRYALSDD